MEPKTQEGEGDEEESRQNTKEWVGVERDMESACTGNGIDVDGDKTSCWLLPASARARPDPCSARK
jgi:hypothetical protein